MSLLDRTSIRMCTFKNKFLSCFLYQVVVVILFSGCSFINFKGDDKTESADTSDFRRVVSPIKNPKATKIDIATEFYEEGELEKSKFDFNVPSHLKPTINRKEASVEATEIDSDPVCVTYCKGGLSQEPAKTVRKSWVSKRRPAQNKKGSSQYIIQPGDTLMKISFENYGDIERWREIFENNKDVLKDFNNIAVGQVIRINGEDFVVVEKNGKPYLIRKNDTLTKISDKLYGSTEYWKNLWSNNKQLIKNPNKIYAGFTLYYQDLGQSLASPLLTEKPKTNTLKEEAKIAAKELVKETIRVPAKIEEPKAKKTSKAKSKWLINPKTE